MSDAGRKGTLIAAGISFALSFAIFCCTYFKVSLPIEIWLVVGVATYIAIFIIVYIDIRFQYHRKVLGPLRRYILYLLSSVTIKDWEVTINIEDGGDGEVIYDFSGKVRFGLNKWVHIGIRSDEPQPCGSEFPTEVTNMLNNRRTDPIFVIDEPTYKRLRIAFGQTLVTGNRFHFRVRFRLLGTFYLGQTDYYTQQAIHHQRKIVINVNFPPTVSVQEVDQRILTEHGDDTWVDKPAEILDPQRVRWEIGKVGFGNSHTLEWRTTRL